MAAFAGLAQTAQQGDPKKNPGGYEEFHSPMVLETVFPMWIKGKRDAWVTSAESQRLRTFRCDRISILSLSTNAREASSGQTEIRIKVELNNPNHNHDKEVALLFEVINGDITDASFKLEPVKVKEGATVTKVSKARIPLSALREEPPTKLRITMTNWDY
jgi:hypothetical protein